MKRSHPIHKKLSLAVFAALALYAVLCAVEVRAADPNPDAILSAAESVFQTMKKGDYTALWGGLTAETQQNTIRNVRKALEKAGLEYAGGAIRKDFEAGGEIARGYWGGYVSQFDPKTVLEESTWKMGAIQKDRAAIIIRYKKSEHDTILQMFREGDLWKVGLDETFATRTNRK